MGCLFLALSFIIAVNSISCSSKDSKDIRKEPVQYRLRQIMIEPVVSEEHEKNIINQVNICLERVKSGEDFTMLAKTFSHESVAEKTGGDLGFFTHNGMVKPFSDAVFLMEPGEVRGPVKTQFGYHIIKLLDVRGEERHAQHILFALKPDRNDSLTALDMLTQIKKRILVGEDFDEMFGLYNKDNLLKETEGYMVWLKPVEMLPSFSRNIQGLNVGDISEPFVSILGFHIVKVDSINYDPENLFKGLPSHIEKKFMNKK